METIARSSQHVQQHPSPTSQFFTAEELAEPPLRPRAAARRPAATCCETCGYATSDLFGRDGSALCADCAAELSAEGCS